MYGNQIRQKFTNSKGNNDTHAHLHHELEEQEAHYDAMIERKNNSLLHLNHNR